MFIPFKIILGPSFNLHPSYQVSPSQIIRLNLYEKDLLNIEIKIPFVSRSDRLINGNTSVPKILDASRNNVTI